MSYRFLEHATDAIVEVRAGSLEEAFLAAGNAAVNLTISQDSVAEKERRSFAAEGKDERYLLFNWLEEVSFLLITQGFAIRRMELEIARDGGYRIDATAYGEPLDLEKHGFKVEIKAPTFYEMEIRHEGGVYMKFLLDL